ncbi:hypothetical protein PF005_g15175 [Phytophthora fragariae]|uniref:Uncharacterized protein n=1 Tax=Phytophthora fragariae TaxID=53985 RepID=A0A6A3K4A0_9STRA|nr:hypothetical protein PF003_g8850 [Phytophthora fragariae]KAE8933482.1 hypothetical protein PF009_g16509 [Phytophthora fragariae]KAE9000417.1 hypothetical protein PF011_g14186 [Phytophthora fragariae]KAE9100452.1 hypothetical protein PF007_g15500 [Phytophthora fragariae]KAE9136786.1 hypothetical protein PF006_g14306 [Phytophthora fragariae]
MVTSDAAFLAEVENFLSGTDLAAVSDNNGGAPVPAPVDGSTKPKPRTRRRTKTPTDAEEKSRLQKAKARTRRKAYLERQKLCREDLKRQVEELTTQLARERAKVLPATSAWKVLAARQLELRQDAETHQRRLCAAVVARAMLIEEFRGVLNDWVLSYSVEMKEGLRRQRKVSDAELYEVYEKELHALYAQTDGVLHDCGLDAVVEDADDSKQTWTRNTKSGHFQFTDRHVVPFGFHETCHSRWIVAHMLHRQEDRQLHDKMEDDENTVALKFRVATPFTSGKVASVLQRIVIRRYEEDERLVIVWRSFMEGEGIFTGMHADETGWGVVTPSGSSVAMEPVAKRFTGVVLDSGAENNSEITNALEKLLLKDEKTKRSFM